MLGGQIPSCKLYPWAIILKKLISVWFLSVLISCSIAKMAHVRLKTRKRIKNKAKGVKRPKFRSSIVSRVRVTGTGKLRFTQAHKAHGMIKHSSRQKERQSGTVVVCKAIAKVVKRFCGLNPRSIKS